MYKIFKIRSFERPIVLNWMALFPVDEIKMNSIIKHPNFLLITKLANIPTKNYATGYIYKSVDAQLNFNVVTPF